MSFGFSTDIEEGPFARLMVKPIGYPTDLYLARDGMLIPIVVEVKASLDGPWVELPSVSTTVKRP